ncbi:MAG: branched-chain amino acid aminotransferase [SAR324 cluster bacterium]|nr:branched-chain amino acid aminotransferase [SAR324 cluster bacterium]
MELNIRTLPDSQRKTPPADISKVAFGTVMTDHMFMMEWDKGKDWHSARIEPYHKLELDPSAMIFHYGPEAFEGLKAYKSANGQHVLFRPKVNFERMNRTAQRMCLPEIDIEFVLSSLKKLLQVESRWIPESPGTSLYIRPTLIGVEEALGLKVPNRFLFFIIMCPVGPYYPEGFNPVKIVVSETYTRAAPGGTGEAKTAGNYAASILAEKEAKARGYTQVLWLDAVERKYVEEVGSMNIFFVIGNDLVTPKLTGTILPGITRQSVLEMGRHWGLNVVEKRISIEEVVQAYHSGQLKEIFGSGTAAVISPVGLLHYKDQDLVINGGKTGPVAQRFFNEITGIQYGQKPDPFSWMVPVA